MVLILYAFFLHLVTVVGTVTVTTKYGDIEGLTRSYPQAPGPHKSIHRFLGIPYASPPIDDLRLKNPSPPKAWKPKVWQAKKHGNACMQGRDVETLYGKLLPQAVTYSEDCLVLDVYTPSINQSLPVMVYIHGGGYSVGTSMVYQGDMLATFGVVVVSIQYRLGPFGFATTGDAAAAGNFGMLDQVEALKWTQENIKHFGGDPNQVTIFGVSAGGTSVTLHMLSPLSADLFYQAIAESGVDLSAFAVQPVADGISYTKQLAEKLNCGLSNSDNLVECLRTKTAEEMQAASYDIMTNSFMFYERLLWSPVIDKHFLLDSPRNLRKEGKFKKAKLAVSFTSHEGGVFLFGMSSFGLPSNLADGVSPESFNAFLTNLANARIDKRENANLIADAMQFMYTPWTAKHNRNELRNQVIDLVGDYLFVAPTHEVAAIHSQFAPVYMYEFAHRPKNESFWPEWLGVAHGENVVFEFGAPFMFNNTDYLSFDAVDRNVSLFMLTAYTNFAKSGSMTPLPGGVEWGSFNSSHRAYLYIDDNPKMASNFYPHRMAFWNDYYPKLTEVRFEMTEKRHVDRVDSGGSLGAGVRMCLQILLPAVYVALYM